MIHVNVFLIRVCINIVVKNLICIYNKTARECKTILMPKLMFSSLRTGKLFLVASLFIFYILNLSLIHTVNNDPMFSKGNVLGIYRNDEEDVNVTAGVFSCELNLHVRPEARAVNNWINEIDVEIYDSSNSLVGQILTTTDNFGDDTTDLCLEAPPILLTGGEYDLYIDGKSHLRKKYDDINGFSNFITNIDTFALSGYLAAGDSSNIDDDEVNSLDFTNIIRSYGLTSIDIGFNDKYDLNMDGVINSGDINILAGNIYDVGE